jgi:hypothetical protein
MATGIALGWVMDPLFALAVMIAWEPLEIFVISPLVGRLGLVFGYEDLHNSLSDIFFDTLGVLLGAYLLAYYAQPPLALF